MKDSMKLYPGGDAEKKLLRQAESMLVTVQKHAERYQPSGGEAKEVVKQLGVIPEETPGKGTPPATPAKPAPSDTRVEESTSLAQATPSVVKAIASSSSPSVVKVTASSSSPKLGVITPSKSTAGSQSQTAAQGTTPSSIGMITPGKSTADDQSQPVEESAGDTPSKKD